MSESVLGTTNPQASPEHAAALADFVRLCTPSSISGNRVVFADVEAVRGQSSRGPRRLYGGVTMVQALIAAAQSAGGLPPHSLHTTFLRQGDATQPITYSVEHLRDGRSF